MTSRTLILRSLRFHARANLGVLLGAAVGSAVLIGALLVGDSVRASLREMGLARIGKADLALTSGDRLFTGDVADRIRSHSQLQIAAALQLAGTASTSDGSARANRVQVLGVDDSFWKLANQPAGFAAIANDGLVLNQPLADQLKVKVGDAVIVRVPKPTLLSRDAPLSPQDDANVALRLKVQALVGDEQFGRFSLQANQVAPFNAFIDRKVLLAKLALTNRANLMLAAANGGSSPLAKTADDAWKASWTLADAEVELRQLPPDRRELELRTDRVFLDPPVVEAALKADPIASLVLTYFVNELAAGGKSTPYSMVTAFGGAAVPSVPGDDEAIINQWLADDLQAKPGDSLSLRYFTVGTSRTLEERTNTFRIRDVVPMKMLYADRELMPEFPGVAKAESTSDWDGSLPVNVNKIRPQDEKYWKDYRGTPKAFISLAAGQKIWSNRFGQVTAVRFSIPTQAVSSADYQKVLEAKIRSNLDPAALGLHFEPVREQALAASSQSEDFGGLFIGFSFFLITAALLLMAMLFQFGVEQRAVEVGTLLALGFTPKKVRRLLLLEGGALAVLGGVLGLAGGIAYARAMIHALTTVWRDAVGGAALQYHATPETLAMGTCSAVIVAFITIWLAVRKQARQPARELLADENVESLPVSTKTSRRGWTGMVGVASTACALLTVGWALYKKDANSAEMFFSAGSLLLVGALCFTAVFLNRLGTTQTATRLSLAGMGVRSATRRRKRSLATVAMLACGAFLIVSIGAFRLDENENATRRESGTGGFALIAESTVAVAQNLNTPSGRDFYGLDAKVMAGVEVVPLRVRDGDDASCLNLNRAQRPRLLGVNPEALSQRGAFTFAETAKGLSAAQPWLLLKTKPGGAGPVPAIADEASILWALGKKVGDTLDYTDDHGKVFKVRLVAALANSMLQGNLLVDEEEFVRRFPSEGGYRMFLIDAPSNRANEIGAALSKSLRDTGLEVTPAIRRLAAFNAVQNTYLSTFQVLGGLGLLLGSVGLGVVVLRNVLERRGELALLLAVGFQPRALKWLVLSEHGALLLLGLASGVLAALVAVLPALRSPGGGLPYASLALTLGGVLVSGFLWTWAATLLALRGRLIEALRNG